MNLNIFSFKKIKFFLQKFEKAENKLEAVYFLKEILILLQEKGAGDEKLEKFLNQIQEEFHFQLGITNWKKIEFWFPDIECSYSSINKLLFIKEELEKKVVYNKQTAWNRLQQNIISTSDRCETMFGQMVPLHISSN